MRPTNIRIDYALAKARLLKMSCHPFDIENAIHSSGVRLKYVFDLEHPTTVRVGGMYTILMPPTGSEPRDFWSMAHEFGHIHLLHYETYPADRIVEGIDLRLLTERETYILEQECDIFVSELLMPN